tara:strand:- start:48 stop:1034 length:987 start_codon:yes stop_codon:yes gene_type:complete
MAAYTTIDDPEKFFQTKLYTGNGGTNAITFDGTSNLSPDFVWLKMRSNADNHTLFNTTSGVGERLFSNLGQVESTESTSLTAFGSDGFTLGADAIANANTETYVSWNWKESATSGFDIVTFTGNQTARTISHSLSAKPEWLWIKNREKDESWHTQHGALGATKTAESNTTGAFGTGSTIWNDTEPTTSVFSVGNNGNINETDSGILVYLWTSKQGYSKFKSYTGNGSADGSFIYTGFKPAFVMIKASAAAKNWEMFDNKRDGFNQSNNTIYANAVDAEGAAGRCNLLSNGFKLTTASTHLNTDGGVFVYMAFAESPFVNSKGVPTNAR